MLQVVVLSQVVHDNLQGFLSLLPQMNEILGDALYSNRNVCSITQGYGIDQYFLPKTNASFRAKGVESWKSMLYDFPVQIIIGIIT